MDFLSVVYFLKERVLFESYLGEGAVKLLA